MRYVGYGAMHGRVRAERGPACDQTCLHCSNPAQDWAYDHNDPDERTESALGVFSLDIMHYIPLCCKCHAKFDRRGYKT